jgi:hypothetical protein
MSIMTGIIISSLMDLYGNELLGIIGYKALSVFAIVIRSRGCESLFSMMGYVKTKFRNRYGDTY